MHYSTQPVVMAPTAAADTRQAVLSCVRSSSSSQQVGELFSVDPEGSTPQQWADASLPYNTRLADEIGPLAIVYRESIRDGALTKLHRPVLRGGQLDTLARSPPLYDVPVRTASRR